MSADLELLAESLATAVARHCADPSPVRDQSETDLIDTLHAANSAGTYMTLRLIDSRRRLNSHPTDAAVGDALRALGSYQHLLGLRAVTA